ncbi:hypothetical protein GCM10007981_06730 [Thermocladium modestius]|uniref:Uncharacterized protein n=1 Tax=Thermocladium modestius TaxID=62609 RepID=A0A830GX95_9CREN|nr:hypothetical protein [Thermocladium modestius]GGP20084.1 hypothetical protein GCM10007981_06730 [Thermocladium modestius]
MRAGIVAFAIALTVGAMLLLAMYVEPLIVSIESGPPQQTASVVSPLLRISVAGSLINARPGVLLSYLKLTASVLDLVGLGLSVYLFLFIRRKASWSSIVDKMREQPLLLLPAVLIAIAVVMLVPLPATIAMEGGVATIATNVYGVASGILYFAGIALAVLLIRFYGYDYDIAYSTFNFDMLDSETIYIDQYDETAAS